VHADNIDKVIPRKLSAKEEAQLRDLAKELSAAGGCPADTIKQAFGEAAGSQKFHTSYVRAVLLDWLGIERNRSP
jgi:DNA replication protein DnaD